MTTAAPALIDLNSLALLLKAVWSNINNLLILWCPEGDLNPHDR